jgi:hypothetical protein
MNDANSQGVSLKSPDALGTSYELEFPADAGSNNQVLTTSTKSSWRYYT